MMATSTEDIPWFKRLIAKLSIKKRAREALQKWESDSTTLEILLTGKTGTGKSKLANALIGRDVAKEGHSLDPETSEVRCYELKIGDVLVKVWDSPGLQDGTEQEEKYRQSIKEKCTNIDLMIYCIQMSETRLFDEDIIAMIKLTRTLQDSSLVDLWPNSIIALTFANEILSLAELNCAKNEKPMEFFLTNLQMWRETLKERLVSDLRFKPEFVEKMAIMPAGLIDEHKLPDPDSDTHESYWLSELWLKALYKTKLDAQPALIKINAHRMTSMPQAYEDKKSKTQTQLLDDMPLFFAEKGAEMGQEKIAGPLGRACGAAFGYSFGVGKSLSLLLDIAIKSKKVSNEDIVVEQD